MKNKITKILIPAALLFLCTSCSSSHLNSSGLGGTVNVSANIDLDANVTVGEEITGTATESYILIFKTSGTSKYLDNVAGKGGTVCSAAAYNAVSSSGADVIINPQYVTTKKTTLFTSKEECTVTGYKGTLSDFR